MAELNPRQEFFCLEYIKDGNATQAAIRAGYSEKTAGSISTRLLQKVNIRTRIDELMAGVQQEKIADAKEVLRYLTSVMRGEAGEDQQGEQTPVSVRDRLKAAELLAKRYGLLTEQVKLSGSVPVQIVDDLESDGDGGS